MKRLLYYLPFHFVVLLCLGIYTQFYYQFWEFGFLKLLIPIAIISLFLVLLNHKKIITFLSFVLFFLIGVSTVYLNNDVNYKNYYKHHLKVNSTVILKVSKVLKSGKYSDKYKSEVIQIDSVKTRGIILLNIKKDSLVNSFKVDEILSVKTVFKELIPPLNPHQFNYKNYLAKQGIHQQLFLANSQIINVGFKILTLKGISANFRNTIQESLKKHRFKANELAVIKALLLGQRQDISKQLITDYSRAGAIHILAVSGLHVGIILLILSWLFKPLEKFKRGVLFKTVLIVFFLWMFAFVAGLSASVVRAVTMFTFLAVGLSFKRKNIVQFSLISSMFFLLIVKPMFLFDVGFQLSYLAVFGIIWVQPKLDEFWKPKLKIVHKIWQLITVSIAAQVGILPLSLFYFHQFPGLFIASNLVIIPFLGTILIGGVIVIFLSLLGFLPQFVADFYGFLISLMNSFVSWISTQEQFLLKEISMSFLMMLTFYSMLILGVRLLMNTSLKRLIHLLISILIVQGVFVFENHQKKLEAAFIIFHKSRTSVIGIRAGEQLLVNHNLDSLEFNKSNLLTSYRIGENVNQILKIKNHSIFKFENESILMIDSLGVYLLKNLKEPIVVLQYSPKINLERLIKTLKPKQIVADGSNYKSYINRWKETCKKQKTPFHFTGKNGAYILKDEEY
jgi:competence protein ComEC